MSKNEGAYSMQNTTQILGLLDLSNGSKKSDHFMFFLDQILINSHQLYIQEKEIQEQNLAWFVGYLALYINIYKKPIKVSPMVRIRDIVFKTSINYLMIMINRIW